MLVVQRAVRRVARWELYWVDLHIVISTGCVTTKIKLMAAINQKGKKGDQIYKVKQGVDFVTRGLFSRLTCWL